MLRILPLGKVWVAKHRLGILGSQCLGIPQRVTHEAVTDLVDHVQVESLLGETEIRLGSPDLETALVTVGPNVVHSRLLSEAS